MKRRLFDSRIWLPMLLTCLAAGLGASSARALDSVTLTYDYIRDDNGDTFHDKSVRVDYKQVWGTAYLGNWQKGGEAGGYLKDRRGSSYAGTVRIREFDETLLLNTEQILTNGYVAKFETRYVHVDEPEEPEDKANLVILGMGFDKYYGDYHYFSVMFYNDPRESGRFSVILSNTLATRDSLIRLGMVPRNDGTVGFFSLVKYHWIFAGYSYTREFDYATFDRRVVTVGVQIPFDGKWSREE